MSGIDYKDILIKNKSVLFEHYPLTELGIFGSFVKNENTENSDIDILINYNHKMKFSLLDFIRLQNDLTDLLKRNVDLVIGSKLKEGVGFQIMKEIEFI